MATLQQETKLCEVCGTPFRQRADRPNARFCSRACCGRSRTGKPSSLLGVKRGPKPRESKLGVDVSCAVCGQARYIQPYLLRSERGKFCSKTCSYLGRRKAGLFQDGFDSRREAQSKALTSIERAVSAELNLRGLNHIQQYIVNGKFTVDIYLPDINLVIECDGDYWHSLPSSIRNDRKKEAYLKACGYRLLRLPEHQIRSGMYKGLLPQGVANG